MDDQAAALVGEAYELSQIIKQFQHVDGRPGLLADLADQVRSYGEQCRRAGAEAMREAAFALAKRQDGVAYTRDEGLTRDTICQAIALLPLPSAAEAASPRRGDLPSLEDVEAISQPGHPLYTSPEQAARAAETIRRGAALVAEAASPAAGWRLVPIEPTPGMLGAGSGNLCDQYDKSKWDEAKNVVEELDLDEIWAAMLDAVPSPPTTERARGG